MVRSMVEARRWQWVVVLVAAGFVAACGGGAAESGAAAQGSAAGSASGGASTSTGASAAGGAAALEDAGAGTEADAGAGGGLDVSGHAAEAQGPLEVTGRSDLPPGPPSTAQPFERVAEAAIAPIRPALAECMRSLGHGPRFYRVTVQADGSLEPRSPQAFAMPNRVAQCMEGVIHGTTVAPAPSRAVPYDIHFDVRD